MEKIHGTNLGNWLVLEKWMKPDLFAATETEDETWLSRKMEPEAFAALIDKVSGKGTWKSNPWVFVYEFELMN